jgi:hypothetical protein
MTPSCAARRVAVLSDVHGNAVALAAVLAELDDDGQTSSSSAVS